MRRQLALTTLATASLIVIAFLVPLGLLVRGIAEDRALDAAERAADALVPTLALGLEPQALQATVDGVEATGTGTVTVYLADGTRVGRDVPADADVAAAREGEAFSSPVDGGVAVFVPAVLPDGDIDVIRIEVPDERLREGVLVSWVLLAVLGVGLLLVALAVADRLARRIVRPVDELADVAHRLGQGELDARVVPDGPEEVAEVGRTLNQLAGRIEQLLEAERESVADLSHRLRTPVTALRLDVEVLADPEARERLGNDVDELTRAVDRLIADARRTGTVGTRGEPAESDLALATEERLAFWGVLADDQERAYGLERPPGPCPVAVAREDLDAALDALLGNVIAHTPEGTAFTVTVMAPDGDGPTLVLDDEGPGFPEGRDLLARGESGGGSSGLGLDIVRTTAERSGGGVELGRSPGGGARIRVTFGPPATA